MYNNTEHNIVKGLDQMANLSILWFDKSTEKCPLQFI